MNSFNFAYNLIKSELKFVAIFDYLSEMQACHGAIAIYYFCRVKRPDYLNCIKIMIDVGIRNIW